MHRILFVAPLLLVACAPACRHRPMDGRIILWEEPAEGFVARCLLLRGIGFESDPRGIRVTHDPATQTALVETLGVLRTRREILAQNLANVETTGGSCAKERGPDGEEYPRWTPYRRRDVFPDLAPNRTLIGRIVEDPADFRIVFDPPHPHAVRTPGADDFGRVYFPNVNAPAEMIDFADATRSCEAVLEVLRHWD